MPELRAISGMGIKGPACFLLEMQGRRLILDLGHGPDGATLPDLSALPPIDAILFSHGHADHTGGLDRWDQLGRPSLFATRPTIAVSERPELQRATPLEDLDRIMDLPLMTGPAGHAPGAVWMRIGGEDGLMYSGDISAESLLFRATPLPRAAALVLDASYGQAAEALPDQIEAIMALADRPVLFPCPAGGRGLELAWTFLRQGWPVSICASHRRVAQILRDHSDWLTPAGPAALDLLLEQAGHLQSDSPIDGVMVAAGPNAERGTSRDLAARIAAGTEARIVLTGHVARDTPASALVAAGRAQFRRWNVHPTFGGGSDLVAACAPRMMLAAFCDPQALGALRNNSHWPIASGAELVW
ncbi:MBL fold metallo-hydrolase [Paracoccus sp. (in: a-proteobacteria)]|uniref:MBL fold metallo-hydrolase n=1 Tax=Paracoccus sp. TaxID=267 RepID=UPI00396C3D7E